MSDTISTNEVNYEEYAADKTTSVTNVAQITLPLSEQFSELVDILPSWTKLPEEEFEVKLLDHYGASNLPNETTLLDGLRLELFALARNYPKFPCNESCDLKRRVNGGIGRSYKIARDCHTLLKFIQYENPAGISGLIKLTKVKQLPVPPLNPNNSTDDVIDQLELSVENQHDVSVNDTHPSAELDIKTIKGIAISLARDVKELKSDRDKQRTLLEWEREQRVQLEHKFDVLTQDYAATYTELMTNMEASLNEMEDQISVISGKMTSVEIESEKATKTTQYFAEKYEEMMDQSNAILSKLNKLMSEMKTEMAKLSYENKENKLSIERITDDKSSGVVALRSQLKVIQRNLAALETANTDKPERDTKFTSISDRLSNAEKRVDNIQKMQKTQKPIDKVCETLSEKVGNILEVAVNEIKNSLPLKNPFNVTTASTQTATTIANPVIPSEHDMPSCQPSAPLPSHNKHIQVAKKLSNPDHAATLGEIASPCAPITHTNNNHSSTNQQTMADGGKQTRPQEGNNPKSGDLPEYKQNRTLLIGSSLFKGIRVKGLSHDVDVDTMRGASISDINHKLQTNNITMYKNIVVYGGGNDIAKGRPISDILQDYDRIIELADCHNIDLTISGLCPRIDADVTELNFYLSQICNRFKLCFVDNYQSFIVHNIYPVPGAYLRDLIHLTLRGTSKLLHNIDSKVQILKQRGNN